LKDLASPGLLSGEVRRPGGGCPTLIAEDPTLLENLRQLLESTTMGDPMRPLMSVSKPRETGGGIARNGPQDRGQQYPKIVGFAEMQSAANSKTLEGGGNPDRTAHSNTPRPRRGAADAVLAITAGHDHRDEARCRHAWIGCPIAPITMPVVHP
jgi:hypothetical protein